jgi:membrane associated rhomboid family serine protease
MLDKLERKLGRYAIPNLVTFLVGGQAVSFVLSQTRPDFAEKLALVPAKVLEGEAWRLVSFLFIHPTDSLLFIIFALMLLYMYGQALEAQWGAFRFNVYVFVGWIASVGAAFVDLHGAATNVYLMASLLLAFAYLFPDYELRLFFVFPVKMKWIGLFTGLGLAYGMIVGDLQSRALIAAALSSFVLFFGRDVWLRVRGRARTRTRRAEEARVAGTPHHRCAVCGDTDLSAPSKQFRYCSQCGGKRAYCMDHLRNHEHVRE